MTAHFNFLLCLPIYAKYLNFFFLNKSKSIFSAKFFTNEFIIQKKYTYLHYILVKSKNRTKYARRNVTKVVQNQVIYSQDVCLPVTI